MRFPWDRKFEELKVAVLALKAAFEAHHNYAVNAHDDHQNELKKSHDSIEATFLSRMTDRPYFVRWNDVNGPHQELLPAGDIAGWVAEKLHQSPTRLQLDFKPLPRKDK
jgi:hypothetical protein